MHEPLTILDWIDGLFVLSFIAVLDWGYGGAESIQEAFRELLGEVFRALFHQHIFGS